MDTNLTVKKFWKVAAYNDKISLCLNELQVNAMEGKLGKGGEEFLAVLEVHAMEPVNHNGVSGWV